MVAKRRKIKYPRPKVIAVDVDGTLYRKGNLNNELVEWCKKQKENGFYMILWSSRGKDHALKAAERSGLKNIFDCIISKPGYIVDNKGWTWIKYTKIIRKISGSLIITDD